MNSELRWHWKLAKRILLNAFIAALFGLTIGMIFGVVTGAISDGVIGTCITAYGFVFKVPPKPYMLTKLGFYGGLMVGGVSSATIILIVANDARPGPMLEPLWSLIARVSVGQIVSAVGYCSLFLTIEAMRASQSSRPFAVIALADLRWFMSGTFLLMAFGALAGALSKRT